MSEVKVDIELLKKLRITMEGAAMSACKDALIEANNDFDKAIEILNIKGIQKAINKAGNVTKEGLTRAIAEGNYGAIAELNCQTDFVANNPKFGNLLGKVLVDIIKKQPKNVEEALALVVSKKETIKDELAKAISILGENIVLNRFQCLTKKDNEVFGIYVHQGGTHAGIVIIDGVSEKSDLPKNIAMQLVSMNPQFIDINEIDEKSKERVFNVVKAKIEERIKNSTKPPTAEIKEKMLKGGIERELAKLTIVDQEYIKNNTITVKQYLAENNATIKMMFRYKVGEDIQK